MDSSVIIILAMLVIMIVALKYDNYWQGKTWKLPKDRKRHNWIVLVFLLVKIALAGILILTEFKNGRN